MILEVAVIVLFLFWAGTLAMFVAYIRSQRGIAAQQAQGDALRDQRIKELAKRTALADTMRCLDALATARDRLASNVQPLLAIEAMIVSLRRSN